MRKLLCLVLLFTLITGCAMAEGSILPGIPASTGSILPSAGAIEAISYGVEMNVYPTSVKTLQDGRQQEYYANVTASQYEAFGVILGQQGYSTANVQTNGSVVTLTLVKESIMIDFVYDSAAGTLTMTYPVGVTTAIAGVDGTIMDHVGSMVYSVQGALEEAIPQYGVDNPFDGFVEITLDTELLLENNGGAAMFSPVKMRLTNITLHMDEPLTMGKATGAGAFVATGETCPVWLQAYVMNLSAAAQSPSGLNSALTNAAGIHLHYVTPDGHYVYGSVAAKLMDGYCASVGQETSAPFNLTVYVQPYQLPSLDADTFLFCFEDVPASILTSDYGILAITFKPSEGEKYVYYIRK